MNHLLWTVLQCFGQTFWLEVGKESICVHLEVKNYWMLTCWQDITFIMLYFKNCFQAS